MNGVRIRSANWLKDGEKSSKFFCNLEENLYRKKHKETQNQNGTNINDQKSVLIEIKKFKKSFFPQQTCQNKEVDLRNFMKNYNLPQ